jgi:hypothetical protein
VGPESFDREPSPRSGTGVAHDREGNQRDQGEDGQRRARYPPVASRVRKRFQWRLLGWWMQPVELPEDRDRIQAEELGVLPEEEPGVGGGRKLVEWRVVLERLEVPLPDSRARGCLSK